MNSGAVREELERRKSGHGREGRLALSVEGGGLRGIVSGSMLAAFEHHGYGPELFDAIFGSSAGALNGAYYLAGQGRTGMAIYYEDAVSKEFIDFKRLVRSGSVVDVEYLVRDVAERARSLDFQAVVESGKLHAIATNVDTGERHVFEPAATVPELQQQLIASARIPVLAGRPVVIDGTRYLDASLSEAIPWRAPIERGFDRVLVLGTRPLGVGKDDKLSTNLSARLLSWFVPKGGRPLVRSRPATSRVRAEELRQAVESGHSDGAAVEAVMPSAETPLPGQVEQDANVLIEAAKFGFNAAEEFLGMEPTERFRTEGQFVAIG